MNIDERRAKILEASPHLNKCGALLEELAPEADPLLIRAAAVAYAAAVLAAFDHTQAAIMLAEASQTIAELTYPPMTFRSRIEIREAVRVECNIQSACRVTLGPTLTSKSTACDLIASSRPSHHSSSKGV